MGDRVVIHVEGAPCSLYMHWGGEDAIDILKAAVPRMRCGDEMYSQARLIGMAHERVPGNTGVGVLPPPDSLPPSKDYSHGDAGVILYNCSSGEATGHHGYLTKKGLMNIGIPPA